MSGVIIDVDTNSKSAQRDLQQINKSLADLVNQAKNSSRAIDGINGGNLRKISASANSTETSFKRMGEKGTGAIGNINKAAEKTSNTIGNIKLAVVSLVASFTAIASVNSFNKQGDALTDFQNKIKQVTKSSEELFHTQRRLVAIARETRSDLSGTADIFNKFSKSLQSTDIAQERIFGVITTLQKAAVSSGSSAESINSAMIQLGQGLSAGVLRGEEWNSVAEQMGDVAQGLARSMGKTNGEMRKFVNEGGLTTQMLIEGLEKMSDATDKTFKGSAVTAKLASNQLRSAIALFFGEINKGMGTSDKFAKNLLSMAKSVDGAADTVFNKVYQLRQGIKNFVASIDLLGGEQLATNISLKLGLSSAETKDKVALYKKAQKYLDGYRDFFGKSKTLKIDSKLDFSFLPAFAKAFIDDKLMKKQQSGLEKFLALGGTTAKVGKQFKLLTAELLLLRQMDISKVVEQVVELGRALANMATELAKVTIKPLLEKIGPPLVEAARDAEKAILSVLTFKMGKKAGDAVVDGILAAFKFLKDLGSNLIPSDMSESVGKGILDELLKIGKGVLSFADGFMTQIAHRVVTGFPPDLFNVIVVSAGIALRKAMTLLWKGIQTIAILTKDSLKNIDLSVMFTFADDGLKAATDNIVAMYQKVLVATSALADKVVVKVKAFGEKIKRIFFEVYDAVVGHSYWPDLIDGVISHTGRLLEVETRIESFASKVKAAFLKLYENIKNAGMGAGGAIREFTIKVTNVDISDVLVSLRQGIAGAVVAGIMIAFGGLGAKFAGLAYLTNLLNRSFDSALSVFAPALGNLLGTAIGDITASFIVSMRESFNSFIAAAPGFIKGFVTSLGDSLFGLGTVITSVASLFPLLTNSAVGSLMAVAAAAAAISKSSRSVIMDILFGSKIGGKGPDAKKRANGLLGFVKSVVFGVETSIASTIKPGFLSQLIVNKGFAVAGIFAALSGMLKNVSLWEGLELAVPLLAYAILGRDGGIAVMGLFFRGVNTAIKYVATKMLAVTGITSLIDLIFPTDAGTGQVQGRVSKAFSGVKTAMLKVITNFRANAADYSAGKMGIVDAFLRRDFVDYDGTVFKGTRVKLGAAMSEMFASLRDFKVTDTLSVGGIFTKIGESVSAATGKVRNSLTGLMGILRQGFSSALSIAGAGLSLLADGLRAIQAVFLNKTFALILVALAAAFVGTASAASMFKSDAEKAGDTLEKVVATVATLTAGLAALGLAYRAMAGFSTARTLQKSLTTRATSLSFLIDNASTGMGKGALKVATDNLEAYEASFKKVQGRLAEIASSKTAFGAGMSGLKFVLEDAFSAGIKGAKTLASKVKTLWDTLRGANPFDVKDGSSVIARMFKTLIGGVKDTEKSGLAGVAERFTVAGTLGIDAIKDGWLGLGGVFGKVASGFTSLVGKMRLGISKMIADTIAWGVASWTANAPWLLIAAAVAAVVGAVGALAVVFFGEGDSFFEKLEYTYDMLKGIFGFSKTSGIGRSSEIRDILGDRMVGDQEITFRASTASVDFAALNEAQYKVALDTANASKAALDNLNEIFIRQGKFTAENMAELAAIQKAQTDLSNRLPQKARGGGAVGIQAEFDAKITEVNESWNARFRHLFDMEAEMGVMLADAGEELKGPLAGLVDVISNAVSYLWDIVKDGGPVGVVKDAVFSVYGGIGKLFDKFTLPEQSGAQKAMAEAFKANAGSMPEYASALDETKRAEWEETYSRMGDAYAEYARLVGEGLDAVGSNAENHGQQVKKASAEVVAATKAMADIRAKYGAEAENRFKTKIAIENEDTVFASLKEAFEIDFGKNGIDFRGTENDLYHLSELAKEATAEADKLKNFMWSEESRAQSRQALADIQARAAAYAQMLKESATLGAQFAMMSQASQGLYTAEDMERLYQIDPEAFNSVSELTREFWRADASLKALDKNSKLVDFTAFKTILANVRKDINATVKLAPTLKTLTDSIKEAAGEELDVQTQLAVGASTLSDLGSAADGIADIKTALDELYKTGTVEQQLAKLEELKKAADDFKFKVAQTKLVPADKINADKSLGPAQKAQGIASALGVSIPENILNNSKVMLRWANIQLEMLRIQSLLNKEIGAGAEGSEETINNLGLQLKVFGEETATMGSATVYTFDSLLGSLGEAGIAINGLSFSRLSASAKSALSGIGTRLEGLKKRLEDVTAGAVLGNISSIMEERVKLLAEAREYMRAALHNTGEGISEGLSRLGISEMKDIARLTQAGLDTLLELDASITVAKLTQNDSNGQLEYLRAAKEIAKLEQKKSRLIELSTKSFDTQLADINDIFGTSLKGIDVVSFDIVSFENLAQQAIDLKHQLEDAIADGATAGSVALKDIFARMANLKQTGEYLSFFANVASSMSDAMVKGAKSSFDRIKSVLSSLTLDFKDFTNMSGKDRRTLARDTELVAAIETAMDLPSLSKEMAAILNDSQMPYDAMYAALEAQFQRETGGTLSAMNSSVQDKILTANERIAVATEAMASGMGLGKSVVPDKPTTQQASPVASGEGVIGTAAFKRIERSKGTLSYEANIKAIDGAQTHIDRLTASLRSASVSWSPEAINLASDTQRKQAERIARQLATEMELLADAAETGQTTEKLQNSVLAHKQALEDLGTGIDESAKKMSEVGKSFASAISDSVNTGFADALKGKHDEGKGVMETFVDTFLDTFTNSVLDSFTAGLLDPLTGENGVMTKAFEAFGASLFGASRDTTKASGVPSLLEKGLGFFSEKAPSDFVGPPERPKESVFAGLGKFAGGLFSNGTASQDNGENPVVESILANTEAQNGFFTNLGQTFMGGLNGLGGLFLQGLGSLGGMLQGVMSIFTGGGGGSGGVNWAGIAIKGVMSYFGGGAGAAASGAVAAASGGYISGKGTGTSDEIAAWLSNGEYVVNAVSTKRYLPMLKAINAGAYKPPKFSTGGLVGGVTPNIYETQATPDAPMRAETSSQVFHINVTGDISRMTRSEIQRMIPQIAAGVSKHNYERRSR